MFVVGLMSIIIKLIEIRGWVKPLRAFRQLAASKPSMLCCLKIELAPVKRKVCILGTLHEYQYLAPRTTYLQHVRDLINIHSVDLVAEEATGVPESTYAQKLIKAAFNSQISWKNVDLTVDERKKVPDINPRGIGTLVDLDLHVLREWVWVIRTSAAMKDAALLICGWGHTFSVAEKFQCVGFDVEIHVYFDKADADRIRQAD